MLRLVLDLQTDDPLIEPYRDRSVALRDAQKLLNETIEKVLNDLHGWKSRLEAQAFSNGEGSTLLEMRSSTPMSDLVVTIKMRAHRSPRGEVFIVEESRVDRQIDSTDFLNSLTRGFARHPIDIREISDTIWRMVEDLEDLELLESLETGGEPAPVAGTGDRLVSRSDAVTLLPVAFEEFSRLWHGIYRDRWPDPGSEVAITASIDQISIELRLGEPRGGLLGAHLQALYQEMVSSEVGQEFLLAAGMAEAEVDELAELGELGIGVGERTDEEAQSVAKRIDDARSRLPLPDPPPPPPGSNPVAERSAAGRRLEMYTDEFVATSAKAHALLAVGATLGVGTAAVIALQERVIWFWRIFQSISGGW